MTEERQAVVGSSSGRSKPQGAFKQAFNSPDLTPPAPLSYRAKPFWIHNPECFDDWKTGEGDRCNQLESDSKCGYVYWKEDVERERRSADALLLSFKEELARQRAETFCRCACDGCQDCQETTLEIKDGKLQENVSWKRRAEAAEAKREEWALQLLPIIQKADLIASTIRASIKVTGMKGKTPMVIGLMKDMEEIKERGETLVEEMRRG